MISGIATFPLVSLSTDHPRTCPALVAAEYSALHASTSSISLDIKSK